MLRGLAPLAATELRRLTGVQALKVTEEALRFRYTGPLSQLLKLRLATIVYARMTFEVPRPKALLGDAAFRRLSQFAAAVVAAQPPGSFTGLRFGAAGADSPVFQRLSEQLSKALKLPFEPETGDLLLRFRRAAASWEVLARLTPRPLSARPYRVCNLPGGLNATLAVAANMLTAPHPADYYLNAMCGSGTLLIERALSAEAATLVGVDLARDALVCAEQNAVAAGMAERPKLVLADATRLPYPAGSFNVITADPPWGDAVGSHAVNSELYPQMLTEFTRVSTPDARLLIITHELKLFDKVLAAQSTWHERQRLQVRHGGHHPVVSLLAKA